MTHAVAHGAQVAAAPSAIATETPGSGLRRNELVGISAPCAAGSAVLVLSHP
jgi:hypothetical protein